MGATYAARLVAYAPNGDRLGVLPEPLSWSASVPRNDVGAATVVYSRKAARGALLQRALHEGLEVAVEVNGLDAAGGGGYALFDDSRFSWDDAAVQWDGLILESPGAASPWVEPDGCRFIAVKRGWSVDDKSDTVTLTMPGYAWMYAKIRSLNVAALLPEDHTEAGKRPFLSANAGVILSTLAQEYEARHSVTLPRDFTTALDSTGAAWAHVTTVYYEHGIPLDVVASNLVGINMVDVTTRGRTWRVTNPSPGADRDVRLHMGVDVAEAPSEETIEDLISHMTIHGGGGLHVTEVDPSAPTPWGPWEGFYSNDSITLTGTALGYAQAELARSGRVRGQYTRDLLATSRHRPFLDFGVGDWITAPTTSPAGERVRVEAITLRQEAGSPLVAGLTLNDRILDAEVKRARRQRGIVGGAATAAGGSDVRPAPDGPDRRTPAAPAGLVVSSSAYIDANGNPRGRVDADWDDVTTANAASGGGALEVAGYELAVGVNVAGAPWPMRAFVDSAGEWVDLDPGAQLRVRVRARGRYATAPGDWSDTVVVTVGDDTTPPPTPSVPALLTTRGTVTVSWDGLTGAATAMPHDFLKVVVAWEGTRAEVPVSGVDALYGAGAIVVPGLDAGTLLRARFQAVDRSGNSSDWTSWSSLTVGSVLDGTGYHEAIEQVTDDVADLLGNVIPPIEAAAAAAVTGSVVEYAVHSSDVTPPTGGWSTSTPTRTPGSFIWMRTKITYGDATTATTAPVLVTGNDGAPGADGTSVNIKGSVATSSALPSSGNTAGDGYITDDTGHLWVWSGSAWTDVGEIRGPQGDPGAPGDPGSDGRGVASITTFFQLTTGSAPAAPTVSPPPAPWTTTEPSFVADRVLWRVERVTYDDNTFSYTPVSRVSSYDAAAAARTIAVVADGRFTGSTAEPTTGDGANKPTGAIWNRYDGNRLIGSWMWTGSAWSPRLPQTVHIDTGTFGELDGLRLAANTVHAGQALVVGSIDDPVLIADGVVTASKLLANEAFAQKLTAALGEFDGVAAGWVTATMFSAGVRGRNLVPDPSLEDDYDFSTWAPFTTGHGSRYQWRRASTSHATAVVGRTGSTEHLGRSGARALRLQVMTGGQEACAISGAIPVKAGQTYRVLLHAVSVGAQGALVVQGIARADDGFLGIGDIVALTGDETWSNPPVIAGDYPTTAEWKQYSYTFTAAVDGFFGLRLLNFVPAAASTILVDDVSVVEVGMGGATELTAAGLRIFDDSGLEVGAFVTGRPNFFSIGSPESTVASISSEGRASFQDLVVQEDPEIAGTPLLGNSSRWQPATDSRNLSGILDRHPWGPAVRGYRGGGVTYGSSQGVLEIPFTAYPGRTYLVTFSGALCTFNVANRIGGFRVSCTTPAFTADGSGVAATPTYASPGQLLFYAYGFSPLADSLGDCPSKSITLRCNTDGTSVGGEINPGVNRLLLSVVINSTGSITPLSDISFGVDVVDLGPDVPNTPVVPVSSGSQPVKGTFTTTWAASDSETYLESNTSRGAADRGDVIHGRAPDAASNGIQWGHILFGGGAVSGSEPGKTLASALSGATILKAHTELYFKHSWYTAGGTVQIRQRTDASVNHSTGTPVSTTALTASSTRRGQTVKRDITNIITPSFRGLQIGKTGSTSPSQYVRIAGHTASTTLRPRVTITYTR